MPAPAHRHPDPYAMFDAAMTPPSPGPAPRGEFPRLRPNPLGPTSSPPRRRPKRRAVRRPKMWSPGGKPSSRRASSASWVKALQRSHDGLLQALQLAEEVQQCLLPRSLPDVPGVKFGASLRPCHYLAGDFYNVTRLDRHHLGIYLGDVMGHGPAAALLSVFAMQSLRLKTIEGTSYHILDPSEVLETLNARLIAADFTGSPFVTMFYGTYDLSRRMLTYCNGGHPPALLLRPGEPAAPLAGRNALLGVFESQFAQESITLRPGDRVLYYSDGFELVDFGAPGEGVAGLTAMLGARDGRSPQELVDALMARIRPVDGALDDLTVILMEVQETA